LSFPEAAGSPLAFLSRDDVKVTGLKRQKRERERERERENTRAWSVGLAPSIDISDYTQKYIKVAESVFWSRGLILL
jgi:hypothetical protein